MTLDDILTAIGDVVFEIMPSIHRKGHGYIMVRYDKDKAFDISYKIGNEIALIEKYTDKEAVIESLQKQLLQKYEDAKILHGLERQFETKTGG